MQIINKQLISQLKVVNILNIIILLKVTSNKRRSGKEISKMSPLDKEEYSILRARSKVISESILKDKAWSDQIKE